MCLYIVQSEQGVYAITNTMQLVASKWTERAQGLADHGRAWEELNRLHVLLATQANY